MPSAAPCVRRDVDIVDQVQRRPMEMIKGLGHWLFKERMRGLTLYSVEEDKHRERDHCV